MNPFQDSEFHELPLKSRVWILKALCEVALVCQLDFINLFNLLSILSLAVLIQHMVGSSVALNDIIILIINIVIIFCNMSLF